MNYQLIGINGLAGAGKDEVASMLISSIIWHKWKIKKFSNRLKESVSILYGVELYNLEEQEFKENVYYNFATGRKMHFQEMPDVRLTIINDVESLRLSIKNEIYDIWVNFRLILQYEGTEIGRNMRGKNFWVNAMFQGYKDQEWIFPDMRFKEELEAIQDRGGLLIKIIRPDNKVNAGTHSSENSLDYFQNWNEVIINDGSLEDLRDKVKEIVKKYNL